MTKQLTDLAMIQAGLNLISQAISIHDSELKLVHANHRFQILFRLPDELMQPGVDFEQVLLVMASRGEYGKLDKSIESFVAEKVALARVFEPHYFERTRADGTTIAVEGCPLDAGGWIAVYTDITDVKLEEANIKSEAIGLSNQLVERTTELARANREMTASVRALEATQKELIESRSRLDLINRMAPAHIAHVDTAGVYTHSNGRLHRILPVAKEAIVGRKYRDVLSESVVEHIDSCFQDAMDGQESVTTFTDKGSGRVVRLAMSPDFRDDDSVRGAYILSTDVTEEVKARRALAHARRRTLAAQLTSSMSHDFSNLLTIIMGQRNKLEKHTQDNAELSEICETIKAATQRGAELVKNLNRIEVQREIEATTVSVNGFFSSFQQLAKAAAPSNIHLEFNIDVPDKHLVFDAGYVQDALLNLVINAAEACEENCKVEVEISISKAGELEFKVSDTGPGFTEEAMNNAVNPFFTTKSGEYGRGMGLTSAFDFAKTCGGNLYIGNNRHGGASVVMTIPYRKTRAAAEQIVLLVDDDDTLRVSLSDYLRGTGRVVIEASNVEEALKLAKLEGISCVLTDLDLGGSGTGLDVATQVAKEIPKLIITGLPISDPRHKKAKECFDVMPKPFEFEAIDAALCRLQT